MREKFQEYIVGLLYFYNRMVNLRPFVVGYLYVICYPKRIVYCNFTVDVLIL